MMQSASRMEANEEPGERTGLLQNKKPWWQRKIQAVRTFLNRKKSKRETAPAPAPAGARKRPPRGPPQNPKDELTLEELMNFLKPPRPKPRNPKPEILIFGGPSTSRNAGSRSKRRHGAPPTPVDCKRAGCPRRAIDNEELGNEFCSKECCAQYSKDVFRDWLNDHKKQNPAVQKDTYIIHIRKRQ